MKNRKLFLNITKGFVLLSIFCILSNGCLETTTEIPIVISLSESSINFTHSEEEKKINITSNTNWNLSNSDSYIKVSPTSGSKNGTVTVTATTNTDITERKAVITITGKGIINENSIKITQEGAPSNLTISPESYNFAVSGGTSSSITVTSNLHAWTISSNAYWLTTSQTTGSGNGSFTMTADANTATTSRNATVAVTGDGITRIVTVTQNEAQATLTVEPINYSFVANGGTSPSVIVTSNLPSWTVTSNQTWLTTSLTSGSGNDTFTMTAVANTSDTKRSATVTVEGGGITRTINVTQDEVLTLTVSPENYNFYANGGTSPSVIVTSNLPSWKVSSNASWLTTSKTTGSGNNTFTMIATSNTSDTIRNATVTVEGGGITRTINVTQDDVPILTVFPNSYSFTANGGTSPAITITSNHSWMVSSNQTWLTTSRTSGSGNNAFTMTATANPSSSSRSATVTVTVGGITRTISVTQDGVVTLLTASPDNYNFYANGGISSIITVTSNQSYWTVSSNQSWLTTSRINGSGNNTFTMTAMANPSSSSRSATVSVTGGGITRTISVAQDGKTDDWVLINGVKWATRNVDKPGTFAATPESAGMFYQWNRKIGWSSTDPLVNSNGGTTWDSSDDPNGTAWEKANDPSPLGYRVPTVAEIQSLLNTTYVNNIWTTQNGINGVIFTDRVTGSSIFLPAVGYRFSFRGSLFDIGSKGCYWSSTLNASYLAWSLSFENGNVGWNGWSSSVPSYGYSIRPVAE